MRLLETEAGDTNLVDASFSKAISEFLEPDWVVNPKIGPNGEVHLWDLIVGFRAGSCHTLFSRAGEIELLHFSKRLRG